MDALIDPTTQDYTLATGALVRDPANGIANAVYLRLMTKLGSYWADPTLGSRLHELQREKDVVRVTRMAQQYAEQALAPLVSAKRVQSVVVSVARAVGMLELTIDIVTLSGTRATFTHPVKVAG